MTVSEMQRSLAVVFAVTSLSGNHTNELYGLVLNFKDQPHYFGGSRCNLDAIQTVVQTTLSTILPDDGDCEVNCLGSGKSARIAVLEFGIRHLARNYSPH